VCPQKLRASFYIDGFNLYHAIDDLGRPHLKWVDLWQLSESLINPREEELQAVYWCTAEHHRHSDKRQRHRVYRKALESVGVSPLCGHFVDEELKCRAECGQIYQKDTEKQGDINVALQLIRDGYDNAFDRCYLVSADSDQAATARVFAELFPDKELVAVAPPGRRHSKHILKYTNQTRTIYEETVERSLFQREVLAGGRFVVKRPARYDPPRGWIRPPKKVRN